MSDTEFLHGVRTVEYDDGTSDISVINVSVVGIVGTAPDSAGATNASAISGSVLTDNQMLIRMNVAGTVGNRYSVDFIDGAVVDNPDVVDYDYFIECVNYTHSLDGSIKFTFKIPVLNTTDKYFLTAADIVTIARRDIIPDENSVDTSGIWFDLPDNTTGDGLLMPFSNLQLTGGVDEPFPINQPSVVSGSKKRLLLGTTGTLPAALLDIQNQRNTLIVVVRVNADSNPQNQANFVKYGLQQLETASQSADVTPRIILATGFSEDDSIAAQIEVTTNKLRGVGYVDMDSYSTPSDAVTRRQKFGGRIELLRPRVYSISDSTGYAIGGPGRAYSAIAAGLRARIDNEKGFWWSKSNQNILGVTGIEQVDDFIIGDTSCTANQLNKEQVSTIIRYNGFRHWGNNLCSTDPQWAFEGVRRTGDVIEDSISQAMMDDFIDRPIDIYLADDIVNTTNAFIRKLTDARAINGGKAWLDPDLNTAEALAAGKIYLNVEFAPKSPAQTITITYRINNDYTVEQFLQAA
ncbi:phage tail sheath subtilisin-like domain-containing protein [Citrobacter sp. S2-9]|uniref:Phage tail sheath subtilisin-like domain-containing protein n=1 Tax=Citrobacter enshiensis TaxID=2971264 RepID=A0ABT8PRP8_9ENTR|nr:phage tail sheath C-terminal domain-containing protein [Citrobacter enshiensis]MDN8599010.1 phage tail sheath subtilisin-like domain-containing protein [Citrobacter enshiensis]